MKAGASDWYKRIWTLDIKKQSWVEETEKQVAFLIRMMGLTGGERVLDLACGFGRHSLSLARRGYRVVGVDITREYVLDAREEARRAGLDVEFLLADIRELDVREEFDVVLNLADGAVGYLENDGENEKIFDVIARALKPGGKHFLDVCSGEHARRHFPKRHWEAGAESLSLAEFYWDSDTRRMLYAGYSIPYGEEARPPRMAEEADAIRLYTREELEALYHARDMSLVRCFSDYNGREESHRELQLLVYARKSGGAK